MSALDNVVIVPFVLTEELYAKLEQMAAKSEISTSELIRRLIEDA